MGTWNNGDGLHVRFGADEADPSKVGEYRTDGDLRVYEATFDLEDITATAQALSNTVKIPTGAVVEKIDVIVLEEPDGASAVLDVGTLQTDYTEYDYDGLLDGLTEADMDGAGVGVLTTFVEGTTATLGGASGADVGPFAAFTEPVLVSAMTADANLFTAGRVKIKIYYSKPHALTKDLWYA